MKWIAGFGCLGVLGFLAFWACVVGFVLWLLWSLMFDPAALGQHFGQIVQGAKSA